MKKGYGSRALSLLEAYYTESSAHADYIDGSVRESTLLNLVQDDQVGLLEENIKPNPQSTPLLQALDERTAEPLHYLAVSYGAIQELLTFWKRNGFTPVYMRYLISLILCKKYFVVTAAKRQRSRICVLRPRVRGPPWSE
ncbi:N-acetyltransferase 10, partial [Halocaridina rubra]